MVVFQISNERKYIFKLKKYIFKIKFEEGIIYLNVLHSYIWMCMQRIRLYNKGLRGLVEHSLNNAIRLRYALFGYTSTPNKMM